MKSLRILIQNRHTKRFYKTGAQWTNEDGEALEFPSVINAFDFGWQQQNFDDLEIVFMPRTATNSSDDQGIDLQKQLRNKNKVS